ncbi:MAG: hypothetical protein OEN23_17320 [Paracoccaceae bacterium]|nr:hypothetical protein [Paracoccaceae bacterium]
MNGAANYRFEPEADIACGSASVDFASSDRHQQALVFDKEKFIGQEWGRELAFSNVNAAQT